MNKRIEQLKEKRSKINELINIEEEKEIKERINPFLSEFVGKCFKYPRNCHSSPEKESDYWDNYRKIIKGVVDRNNSIKLIVEEFSINSLGECEFLIKNAFVFPDGREPFEGGGWIEISEEEYYEEKDIFWKECADMTKLEKIIKKV